MRRPLYLGMSLIVRTASDIYYTIRSFKRSYHRVKSVFDDLSETDGKVSFEIVLENGQLRTTLVLPEKELLTRFIVLMQPFLSDEGQLYFQMVWQELLTAYPHDVPEQLVSAINEAIRRLQQGCIHLNIDGRPVSAAEVYTLVGEGEFFDTKEAEAKLLQQLTAAPPAQNLFWHQFYRFSLDGFYLIHYIFLAIQKIEKSTTYLAAVAQLQQGPQRCIYCLAADTSFTSEEHVFPESLGNDEIVLPKGYVCDRCNNGVLASLDEHLLKTAPVATGQVLFVPYTKAGKLPVANFQNLTIRRTGPRTLVYVPKDRSGNMKNERQLENGLTFWEFSARGTKFDLTKLAPRLIQDGTRHCSVRRRPRICLYIAL